MFTNTAERNVLNIFFVLILVFLFLFRYYKCQKNTFCQKRDLMHNKRGVTCNYSGRAQKKKSKFFIFMTINIFYRILQLHELSNFRAAFLKLWLIWQHVMGLNERVFVMRDNKNNFVHHFFPGKNKKKKKTLNKGNTCMYGTCFSWKTHPTGFLRTLLLSKKEKMADWATSTCRQSETIMKY